MAIWMHGSQNKWPQMVVVGRLSNGCSRQTAQLIFLVRLSAASGLSVRCRFDGDELDAAAFVAVSTARLAAARAADVATDSSICWAISCTNGHTERGVPAVRRNRWFGGCVWSSKKFTTWTSGISSGGGGAGEPHRSTIPGDEAPTKITSSSLQSSTISRGDAWRNWITSSILSVWEQMKSNTGFFQLPNCELTIFAKGRCYISRCICGKCERGICFGHHVTNSLCTRCNRTIIVFHCFKVWLN